MIKYDGKTYLSQVVTQMFDSLQYDSTKCALQYECNSLITIATYWVPDLPNIKGIKAQQQTNESNNYHLLCVWLFLSVITYKVAVTSY